MLEKVQGSKSASVHFHSEGLSPSISPGSDRSRFYWLSDRRGDVVSRLSGETTAPAKEVSMDFGKLSELNGLSVQKTSCHFSLDWLCFTLTLRCTQRVGV